jgi:undecaprenyl pyrophosphate synthase
MNIIGIDEDLQRGIKSSIARKGYAPRLEITTLTTSPEPKRSEEDGNQPSLSIRLLKHDNGQRMLVEIAESWAEIRRYGPPSGDSLTDEVIARRLKDIYGTAPDLIIIFGSRLSGRFPGVVS